MKTELPANNYSNADEISLIDLWMVLMRHKKLMAIVITLCLVIALAFALLKKKVYTYSSSIEIGSVTEQGKDNKVRSLIDNPSTLLAKIQEGYIPVVLNEYDGSASNMELFKITARVPKGSSLVVLEARAGEKDGEVVKHLEDRVIELVKADHARILDIVKTNIKEDLAKEQRTLSEQLDSQKIIAANLEHNKVLTDLLKRQIGDASAQLKDAMANRRHARDLSGNESQAMTLLLIDNEIEHNRQWVAQLEERLQILIPRDNDGLEKSYADILREQDNTRARIEQLQVQLQNIQETRALIKPTRSLEPVGPDKALIVILGGVLGGILALFAAFFAEFLQRAREQIDAQSRSA